MQLQRRRAVDCGFNCSELVGQGEERLLRRSLSAPGDEQGEGVRCQVVESGPMTDEAQGVATVRGRKQLDAMPAKWQGKIHQISREMGRRRIDLGVGSFTTVSRVVHIAIFHLNK